MAAHRLWAGSRRVLVALGPILILLSLGVAPSAAQAAGSQADWERTLKAAEQEGEVMVYVGGAEYQAAIQEFQKAFPSIKLSTYAAARGPELLSRLMAERRAGKNLVDVYMTGIGTHIALYNAKAQTSVRSALTLPDVRDASKWFEGKHRYLYDKEGMSLVFEGAVARWISYNATTVKPDEINSWWDLTNPKWKGRIVSYDPTIPGTAAPSLWFYHTHPDLGAKFIEDFYAKNEVTFSRDYRQLIDWLATGKAVICIACSDEARRAKLQGLPIESLDDDMKEGHLVTYGQGILSMIQPAPHPNAAKVFVNWLLSQQGQRSFQKVTLERLTYSRNSLRIDLSKDKVLPEERLRAGGRYFYEGSRSGEERKESVQALKQAMKR